MEHLSLETFKRGDTRQIWYSRRNLVMLIYVFRENVVISAISELRPGSKERYENSTGCLITDPSKVEAFYGQLECNLKVFWPIYSKFTLVHLLSKHKMIQFYCKN